MAVAEKNPEKLHARNRGLLQMRKKSLHDFSSTPEKGLPEKAKGKQQRKKKHWSDNIK